MFSFSGYLALLMEPEQLQQPSNGRLSINKQAPKASWLKGSTIATLTIGKDDASSPEERLCVQVLHALLF